jgi:hypothetical protein
MELHSTSPLFTYLFKMRSAPSSNSDSCAHGSGKVLRTRAVGEVVARVVEREVELELFER